MDRTPRSSPAFERGAGAGDDARSGVSFYQRWILPPLLDFAMRNKEATRFRAELVPRARGAALEVGVGSGLNLRFYGNRVERLVAVDPSEELLRMARKRSSGMALPIELIVRQGEALPLDDASIDSVYVV